MTTEKGIQFAVVLLATLLFCTTEAQSQALPKRESGGGAIQRTHTSAATTPLLFKNSTVDPLAAGSYTVGTGGYFPTLDSAFARLSGGGILGSITLLLTDTLYVASSASKDFLLLGPISGAGPSSRITIRPADNVAGTIRGSGTASLTFHNVSYLTLDGISLQGSTRLNVHTLLNKAFAWNDGVDFWGDCDHDVVQNLSAASDDIGRLETAGIVLLEDDFGAPDSCLVSGVSIRSGGMGIFVGGYSPSFAHRPTGNVLRGCQIGSTTDSLISRAVQLQGADGTLVESNHIENLRLALPDPNGDPYVLGISAYYGRNEIIRNNVVHNLCATVPKTIIDGIALSGSITKRGANEWVYNNMVYDIRNRVSQDVDLNGIGAWRQDSARIDFNSVCLSPTGSTHASIGSSALAFYPTATLSTARNNILVNLREELSNVAVAIWDGGSNAKLSDYNDLHVGPYDSSLVALIGTKRYKTIDDLHSDSKEVHSVSMLPVFAEPYLHIDSMHTTTEYLLNRGIPIGGIVADFDGQLRDVSRPDIGADEIIEVKSPGGITWTKDPRNPVLSGGGAAGYRHAMNPCVLYNEDSSRFEMWFNRAGASSKSDRPWLIGYATSPDGIHWNQRASAVLTPTPGTWDAFTTEAPVIIREDGVYKMWYSSYLNPAAPSYIGYATSLDGINWTKYAGNPIFGPGTAAWEAGGPYFSSVMPVPGGYRIWYDAYDVSENTSRIGYATSTDGIAWQRDTLHNPLMNLGISGAWDDNRVGAPRVLRLRMANSSDMYLMWYVGVKSDARYKSGLAMSPDGITGWIKSPHNPVLVPDPGFWDGTDVGITSVMLRGDSLYAWYDGGTYPSTSNPWQIGRAVSRTPVTDVDGPLLTVPAGFALEQNYPNPFNPSTAIKYELPKASHVSLTVYDVLGREVSVLVNERRDAGVHEVKFDASNLASGMYFYRLQAGDFVQSKKLVLLK